MCVCVCVLGCGVCVCGVCVWVVCVCCVVVCVFVCVWCVCGVCVCGVCVCVCVCVMWCVCVWCVHPLFPVLLTPSTLPRSPPLSPLSSPPCLPVSLSLFPFPLVPALLPLSCSPFFAVFSCLTVMSRQHCINKRRKQTNGLSGLVCRKGLAEWSNKQVIENLLAATEC